MPLVQQFAVLVNDAQFRCNISSFVSGLCNILFSVVLPYSIMPFTFFLPSVAALRVFNPFKRLMEDCVLPLVMLPLSVVAGIYFLFAPLYGDEQNDPEIEVIFNAVSREPSKDVDEVEEAEEGSGELEELEEEEKTESVEENVEEAKECEEDVEVEGEEEETEDALKNENKEVNEENAYVSELYQPE